MSSVGSQLIGGTSFANIDWLSVGISAALGGLAGAFSSAGLSNKNAQNSSKYISKAMKSIDKVNNKIAMGGYKTIQGMRSAITQVENMGLKAFSKYLVGNSIKLMGWYSGTSVVNYIIGGFLN